MKRIKSNVPVLHILKRVIWMSDKRADVIKAADSKYCWSSLSKFKAVGPDPTIMRIGVTTPLTCQTIYLLWSDNIHIIFTIAKACWKPMTRANPNGNRLFNPQKGAFFFSFTRMDGIHIIFQSKAPHHPSLVPTWDLKSFHRLGDSAGG